MLMEVNCKEGKVSINPMAISAIVPSGEGCTVHLEIGDTAVMLVSSDTQQHIHKTAERMINAIQLPENYGHECGEG